MAKFRVIIADGGTYEVLAASEEPTETLVQLLHNATDLAKKAWDIAEARAATAKMVADEDRVLGRIENPGYDESDNPSNGWRCPEKGD